MPCHFFAGGVVCSGRARRKRCKTPGHADRWAVAECDWRLHQIVDGAKVYTGKTCDRPLCAGCRKRVGQHLDGPHRGEPKDLCPAHYAEADRRGYLAHLAVNPPSTTAPDELTAPPFRSPHSLWLEAGGDRDRYIALMKQHGNLVDITDEDAGTVH